MVRKTVKMQVMRKKKKGPGSQAMVVRGAPVRMGAPQRPLLDKAAAEYAALIKDPCNARLTNTIWPGAEGSIVSRFESDQIIFNDATATAGLLVFVPNNQSVWRNATLATSDTTTTTISNIAAGPGATFAFASCGTIRCVAACAQISFPGTELNRSGLVSCGVMPFGDFYLNIDTSAGGVAAPTATTVANVRTLTQHVERTPQNMCEVTWFPGPGDMKPWTPGQGASNQTAITQTGDCNALVLTCAGLPAGVGARVRFVAVYEWTPKQAQGLVSTVEAPRSSNSLNDVLRVLHGNGPNWFINAYQKAAPYLRATGSIIGYAAKTLGPALLAM